MDVINLDTYNKLPFAIQKIFDEEGAAAAQAFAGLHEQGVRDAIAKAHAKGVEIYRLADDVLAQMEALGKPVAWAKWFEELAASGISEAKAQAALDKFLQYYHELEPTATFPDWTKM